jgi:predicted DNA-binding protein
VASVTIPITDELYRRIERLARRAGLTPKAYLECAINEKLDRDAESVLRSLGALRTRSEDEAKVQMPADEVLGSI